MLSCWIHFSFIQPQGPVPHCHGHDVAPRGVHLRPLQRLPGGEWLRGGAGPLVLRELLRAVLCSHLRPLPAEDSGGESHSFRVIMQLSVCRNQLNTAGAGRLKGGKRNSDTNILASDFLLEVYLHCDRPHLPSCHTRRNILLSLLLLVLLNVTNSCSVLLVFIYCCFV